jgi:hypothetical protein
MNERENKPESEIFQDIDEIIKRRYHREKAVEIAAPLRQVDDIKRRRTIPGEGKVTICGIPVDVFSIEDWVIKASPLDISSLLRLEFQRGVECGKNNMRPEEMKKTKIPWGLIILVIAIAAGALLFIFFILPQLGNIKIF